MQRIKKGDEVVVISGRDKGKRGTVLRRVDAEHLVVEGVNRAKKHMRPNPMKNVTGGIVDKDMPIHISNVALYNPATQKADRVGFKTLADGRKVRGTIHWVSAPHAARAEIRLYHPLFTRSDPGAGGDLLTDLNPDSREVLQGAMVEPSLATDNAGGAVQFERQGYFCRDPDSAPRRLVFNRTIGLRDSWTKTRTGSP